MDLALNNLQRLIYQKTQPSNQPGVLPFDEIPATDVGFKKISLS